MKNENIQKLIYQCLDFFQENNYTPNRIGVYKTLWKHGIVQYMEAKGLTVYTPEIGAAFTSTCHLNGTVRPQEREKIKRPQLILSLCKVETRSAVDNILIIRRSLASTLHNDMLVIKSIMRSFTSFLQMDKAASACYVLLGQY